MTDLKRRVASQKILQFLQNNKVIFFFQKKSLQNDHWRLLEKKIAKIQGIASLNFKNKRDKKEMQTLILSYLSSQGGVTISSNSLTLANSPIQKRETLYHSSHSLAPSFLKESNIRVGLYSQDQNLLPFGESLPDVKGEKLYQLEMVERICGLLYAPNLALGSNSLEKLASLSHQLKEDSNLIFVGGWDGNQLINHLDSFKLLETAQDVWKEGNIYLLGRAVSSLSFSYARPYYLLHQIVKKRESLLLYSLKEKMRALLRCLQERKAQQVKEKEEKKAQQAKEK